MSSAAPSAVAGLPSALRSSARRSVSSEQPNARVEVAACFMIRDKNFADAAIREVRISGDEADSVLFEVEACCRAPVRQPLANVT
jgi:hypothetical protein